MDRMLKAGRLYDWCPALLFFCRGELASDPRGRYLWVILMERIYLDHTATTPIDPAVREAMYPYLTEVFGNPSSIHWYGRKAKSALEESRERIARVIGAEPGELFFTSGGTESDNLAIKGVMKTSAAAGRNHVVTSAAEHHAVLDPCEALSRAGLDVSILPVDASGSVAADRIALALRPSTALVSVMHANNEVGTINPLRDISRAARAVGALVHSDAVQTVGRIPVDVRDLGVDLMTFTAHKLYGPKGVGALFVKRGIPIDPIFEGGGQERGKRPGTENVASAVGFAMAVELSAHRMERESRRLALLRERLEAMVQERFRGVVVNGHPRERLPHILNISFDDSVIPLEGEMLVPGMDLQGIAVTSGSACTSGSMQPSHVLLAMGRDPATARATIRFSFGQSNSESDLPKVIAALGIVVEHARRSPPEASR